jgi:ParB family chromosome partitioning protein
MTTQEIALNKLVLSPLNMRQGDVDVSDLIASFRSRIAAKKPVLLQNLRVTAQVDDAGKATGLFEVHVGGRRFRALTQLADAKTIKKTHPVACVVTDDRLDAMSESVEENTQRLDPHPVDQYLAFAALIEAGYTPAQVAGRFGIEEARVMRRMALAKVSPKLLALHRTGEIDFQTMAAFTLTEDQEAQEAAYFGVPEGWQRNANSVRQRLTQGEVNSKTSRLARLVGLDAYRAAGGAVRLDLFAEEGEGYIQDPALVENLAAAILEKAAEEVRAEGWKWVRVNPTMTHQDTEGLPRIYPERSPLDQATIDAIEALSEQYQAMEAEGLGETAEGAEAMDQLESQIAALEASTDEAYRPEEVAIAGAFVTVSNEGLSIQRGFVDKADKKALARLKEKASEDAGEPSKPKTVSEAIDDAGAGLSGILKENLSAHHTVGIRAALLDNPAVALVATVHRLLLIGHYRHDTSARDHGVVRLEGLGWNEDVNKHAPDLADGPAVAKLAQVHEAMLSRLPTAPADLWGYLLPLGTDDLLQLLAYATSYQVFAIQAQYAPKARTASAYALADALSLDMADYWTPTAENFFGRVGKPETLAAVREVCGEPAAAEMTGLKKSELAAQAESALDGSRWLPAMLRRHAEADDGADLTGDETAEAA